MTGYWDSLQNVSLLNLLNVAEALRFTDVEISSTFFPFNLPNILRLHTNRCLAVPNAGAGTTVCYLDIRNR